MLTKPHFNKHGHKPQRKQTPRYRAPEGANAVVAKFVKTVYFIKRDENGRHIDRLKKTYLYPKPYIFSVADNVVKKLHPGVSLFVKDASGNTAEVMVAKVIKISDPSKHESANWNPKLDRSRLGVVRVVSKTEFLRQQAERQKKMAKKKHFKHDHHDRQHQTGRSRNHFSHYSTDRQNSSKYYTDRSLIKTHYSRPKQADKSTHHTDKQKQSTKTTAVQYNKHGIPINFSKHRD